MPRAADRCRGRGSRRPRRSSEPRRRGPAARARRSCCDPARPLAASRCVASEAPGGGCAGPGRPPRWRRRRPARRLRSPAARNPRAARLDRLRPARLPQAAAFADLRRRDSLRRGQHLERVAALVAEPAVVDLVVVAGQHPLYLFVADREGDVALRRAQRADRAAPARCPRAARGSGRGSRSARRPGRAGSSCPRRGARDRSPSLRHRRISLCEPRSITVSASSPGGFWRWKQTPRWRELMQRSRSSAISERGG